MKQIYAGLFCLSLLGIVSTSVPVSAQAGSVGIGASERYGVHQDRFERNRFLYTVAESSMPENSYGGRRDPQTRYQRRQDQSSGTMGNIDINTTNMEGNQTMSPSADVPDSVRGQSGAPNMVPNIRPGGDPAVRDLGGSGMPGPGSAPAGTLGR